MGPTFLIKIQSGSYFSKVESHFFGSYFSGVPGLGPGPSSLVGACMVDSPTFTFHVLHSTLLPYQLHDLILPCFHSSYFEELRLLSGHQKICNKIFRATTLSGETLLGESDEFF